MKNIKIKQLADDNSVKVTIGHSYKMAANVDRLIKLNDSDFRKVVIIAKKYRKANKSMAKFIDKDAVQIKIESTKNEAYIVNGLVDLGNSEFRKTIRCARKYRKANKELDSAIHSYVKLQRQDRANFQTRRMGLAYEAS